MSKASENRRLCDRCVDSGTTHGSTIELTDDELSTAIDVFLEDESTDTSLDEEPVGGVTVVDDFVDLIQWYNG